MSYQALARTLRPKDFSSIVGQEHVVKALQNSIKKDMLHHAYLFSGTRGVGKTTIARVFAKCLNCETGLTANPCGTCNACVSIEQNNFPDLIELDAASKTKAEDTRDLLDTVMYAPVVGRYKVYIIDEVHMLSTHSFNAFLKTLEEPPAHVKFILATTDPKKLPVTVLSRCLQFNLRSVTTGNLTSLLEKVLQERGIKYDATSVRSIARQANGSIRDLLSLTEQVIAMTDNAITNDSVESLLGSVSYYDIVKLLESVIKKDTNIVLNKLKKMQTNNVDFSLLLEQFLEVVHNIIVAQHLYISDKNNFINLHSNLFDFIEIKELESLLTSVSPEVLQYYYQTLQIGYKDLEYMPDSYMVVEMALLRMIAFFSSFSDEVTLSQNKELDSQKKKITEKVAANVNSIIDKEPKKLLEDRPAESKVSDKKVTEKSTVEYNTNKPDSTIQTNTDSKISSLEDFDWNNLVSRLHLKGLEKQLIEHLEFLGISGDKINLNLNKSMACLFTEPKKKGLEEKISIILKNKVKLEVNVIDGDTNNSIAAKKSADYERKQQAAIEKIQKDPHVTELVNTFDAKVDINNIELLEKE